MSKAENGMVIVLIAISLFACAFFGKDLFPNVDWGKVVRLTWESIVKSY